MQPAPEMSSDPGTCAFSSHLKNTFFAPEPIPVYRAIYWCGQKCTYPDQEEYNSWKEAQKQEKHLQNQEKRRGHPTKV